MPYSLEEAVQVSVTVSNAERKRAQDTKRVCSAKNNNSPKGVSCFEGKGVTMQGILKLQKGTIIRGTVET
jgi:hypothetical protein